MKIYKSKWCTAQKFYIYIYIDILINLLYFMLAVYLKVFNTYITIQSLGASRADA